MLVMYEHSEKRLVDRLKIEAGFHGIKLNAPQTISSSAQSEKCVPGDPDSYNHLSDEERAELTKKMMGRHKFWNSNDNPMGEDKAMR